MSTDRDRVPLVRHRRRPALARVIAALGDLGDLGLREQRNVPGYLAERGAGARERRGQLQDAQPVGVPGQRRLGEAKLLRQ